MLKLNQKLLLSKKAATRKHSTIHLKTLKLLFTTSLLISCSSTNLTKYDQSSKDILATSFSVKVKFAVESKNRVLNIQIVAKKFSQIRLDISSTLGINVASIALDGTNLTYYIHNSGEYFNGKYKTNSFAGIDFPITLNELNYFLFNQEPDGWQCVKSENILLFCSKDETRITFQKRGGTRRLIKIDDTTNKSQFYIKKFNPNIKTKLNIFSISKP